MQAIPIRTALPFHFGLDQSGYHPDRSTFGPSASASNAKAEFFFTRENINIFGNML